MKYVDITAIIQVIGSIYQNSSLLDNENYFFNEDDFTEEFHKILFGSMFNLHALGAKNITVNTIEDYLKDRPKSLAVYKANKGAEYLQKIAENVQLSTFDYYYQRMKKMTLLRMYQKAGMDLSWLYDMNNILDIKKKQAQEDWFDNTSLDEMADIIDRKITEIRLKYVDDTNEDFCQAGDNINELIERLQQNPEIGYPLYGPLINTVTRGARLKKFYLWSAATGVGKTRNMIAHSCSIACDELYDSALGKWVPNGTKEPTIFITTEQEVDEIQTMMLAFLSDVDENHIIYNDYYAGELDRVLYAAQLMKKCPIYIKKLPDFSLKDIENTTQFYINSGDAVYFKESGKPLGTILESSEASSIPLTITPSSKTFIENGKAITVMYPPDTRIDAVGRIKCEGTFAEDGTFLLNGTEYISPGQTFTICTEKVTLNITVISAKSLDN